MINKTVLLSSLWLMVLDDVIWLAYRNMSARVKRLSIYPLIDGLVVSVVMIMRRQVAKTYLKLSLLMKSISPNIKNQISVFELNPKADISSGKLTFN